MYVGEFQTQRKGLTAISVPTDFLPLDGRWVVERTISCFSGTHRMMRNYEKYLHTAVHMAYTCMVAFMLRYFR
ncbi:MAG: transposase [Muribaculaceae bacterium]|nr:transposase [Muribaculaceae bacterium]